MKSKFFMRNKFFSMGMIVFLLLFIIACGDGVDTPAPTYNISGAVSGATVAGVTINLTGAATATTTTDASGNYSFTGRANGTYTVTPVKAGYIFNPVSSVAFVSGASVTGINFVATANAASTYSISGTVTGAVQSGVTMTLSGGATGTTTTNALGVYSFSVLVNGGYTVTPSRTGYTFSPTHQDVTLSGANSPGNDFTSAAVVIPPATYSISGAVSGTILAGVTINLTGTDTRSTMTDSSGTFSITGLANGPYTLTPIKEGYTFAPSSSAATVSGADITGKNFVAAINILPKYNISGAVSGDVLYQVTITLSGAGSATTITNPSGNYSFSGLVNGSYTVTPSKTGYTFSPTSSVASVSGADITGKNFVATANTTTYTQADLTGSWRMNNLRTGDNKWMRALFSINPSGVATCFSMSDSTGGTTCPTPFDLTFTMNTTTGVITQSGANAANAGTDHMTMTSNKNFAAGTGTNGDSPNYKYQLGIAQKVVPGTVYTNADVQNKSFVYHQLMISSVGADNKWEYGAGTTGSTGLVNLSSVTNSIDGTTVPGATGVTLSVNSVGEVTMSGDMANFQGFLSDDKKTIVGINTDGGGSKYHLMIYQIIGQTYPAGPLPAGISFSHMLGCGIGVAFWVHNTITVDSGGGITFSDWADSIGGSAPSGTYTGSISASGTVLIAGNASYHGQVSHDSKFTVATQTSSTGRYVLQVNTK